VSYDATGTHRHGRDADGDIAFSLGLSSNAIPADVTLRAIILRDTGRELVVIVVRLEIVLTELDDAVQGGIVVGDVEVRNGGVVGQRKDLVAAGNHRGHGEREREKREKEKSEFVGHRDGCGGRLLLSGLSGG
jgi:hypothetical protein